MVAERTLLLPGPDGHRHHGTDRGPGGDCLPAREQPVAQGAGDGREDDIVDGAAVCLANALVVVELSAGHAEPALLADRHVERAVRRRLCRDAGGRGETAQRTEHLSGGRPGVEHPDANAVHDGGRPANDLRHSVDEQTDRARLGLRHPQVRGHLPRCGRHVQDHLADVDGADSVDHRVVSLRDHGDPTAFEALHQVHLPQRAAAVEPTGHQAADELT